MTAGAFCLVLHTHLPYVRHAGRWPFGEENLYEAMQACYLPLLRAMDELLAEGITPHATIGITPVLAEQLADPELQEGFRTYLRERIRWAAEDRARFAAAGDLDAARLAYLTEIEWTSSLEAFGRLGPNLLDAFNDLARRGAIELITSAATHGLLPLLGEKTAVDAQIQTGVASFRRHFEQAPRGFWLPECAYASGIEQAVAMAGLGYFFVESTAVEGGEPPVSVPIGPYAPRPESAWSIPPSGHSALQPYLVEGSSVAVLARHPRASQQVWSAERGYPGAGAYREFHRKDEVSGHRYWRVTDRQISLAGKGLYDPIAAMSQVEAHADQYVGMLHEELDRYRIQTGQDGVLTVPFDTELFGHWWHEGVAWLKAVWRRLATTPRVKAMTVSQALAVHPPTESLALPESSWGAGGDFWVWDNPDVAWIWPWIRRAEAEMAAVAQAHSKAEGLVARALKQAARELMLLESSDWPFLMTTGQAKLWAASRFMTHLRRFMAAIEAVRHDTVSEALLADLEADDVCFPEIDWSLYRGVPVSP